MVSTKRPLSILFALVMMAPVGVSLPGMGTHFGEGHIPAGCNGDSTAGPHFTDGCYHMRTNLNGLDTPIIDVLIVPPASSYPERDVRVMRQAVEMWDAGVHFLAPQMGLDWLLEVEFNIFVDDGSFESDPLWDPEIIIVSSNPAGGAGIGIDPVWFAQEVGLPIPDPGACKGANPLASLEAWDEIPGFENHHGHSGTYVEECEGGGSVCYAVNGAIDPVPGGFDFFEHFDLVAHEFGHCLSTGHVGDAGDHTGASVPTHDIMAYTNVAHDKCVSTLDVEAFAIRMSQFLLPAPLVANHVDGPGGEFQIQHPDDHYYASSTGLPEDCPQPDDLLVSSGPVSFTPSSTLVERSPPELDITSHADGDNVTAGPVSITGTVRYGLATPGDGDGDQVPDGEDNCPTTFN
ncbi:MAG: hypothetical protein ACT4PT_13770, partial [Methanobacteriota archaeon]